MNITPTIIDRETDEIRVLHVDDDSSFADLAATFLEREDDLIEVQTALNAEAGLEILAEDDVDCVVSDYDMPGRNGIEFLEAVREQYPDLPFILYTGKGSEEIASDAISAGVTDYLQKERGTDQYAILANWIQNYVDRTRTQREQEAIRERMQLSLEETHSVIFEINLDTGVVTRYGDFERYFNFPSDDIPTWDEYLERVVHPDDREAFRQFYQQLSDGDRDAGTVEYRTNPKTGTVRWIRADVHLNKTAPDHVLGIAQDVTAQKKQEQKRKRIIKRVTDAIVEVNSEWEFTLVNEQAEKLYAMDEEYLLGRDFWDVFPEARGTRFEDEYRRVMDTRESTSFVEYFSQLDGWFDIKAYPKQDGGIAFYFIEVTDQRERQHELEQTNALLSTLIETLPVGVIVEDSSRNVLTVNERLSELFDLSGSPEEVAGADCDEMAKHISDMFVDSAAFVERITEVVSKGEPTDHEELALHDGRTFERSYRTIELPDGNGHLWVYQDITEQKNREQQLHEEQQFVKSIFNALPDPLYTFDMDGYPQRWNNKLEKVTGYTGDEIPEIHLTEFIPEGETNKITSHFQTTVEERQPVTVESVVETKHGDRIPFEFTGAPLEDGDGTLCGITGVGRDITERKAHEEQLRSLNKQSQELMAADTREQIAKIGVEAARDILNLDLNAIHLYEEDQSGLVPVAATNAVYDLIGEPPVFTGGESIAWRAYANREVLSIDDIYTDPDVYNPETPIRSELHFPLGEHGILMAGSPTPDSFDQQDRILGQILASNIATALEQAKQTEQLRAREQELTRQNARLEEFANTVSHDLRNPLTLAEGRLELAQEECKSEHHDVIAIALDRIERIIEDMLWLAREGEDIGSTEPVSLQKAVEDTWMIATDDTDNIEIVVSGDEDLGTIDADYDRLCQFLENLFRNAVEHGGEDVTVIVGRLDNGFYVADTGPGIPPDQREDVFETGYSTSQDGTGFGLSIVEKIAEAHNWNICVAESSQGGARFEIIDVEFVG